MNVALLGTWHVHAEGYVNDLCADSRCTLTAVWDKEADKAQVFGEKFGCHYYTNLDEMLQKETIDGVIVCSPTSDHEEVILKAVHAGKHIFTEKVLAITLDGAKKIQEAVNSREIKFVISYPHKCNPKLVAAKELVSEEVLGKITYVRVRNAHNGSIAGWLPSHFYDKETCGGGAMMDLGAHPMYTLIWLLGKPLTVTSTFTNVTEKPVEDNAVSVMIFANGAIGVSETGFVSTYDNYSLEINGTEGAFRTTDAGAEYISEQTNGNWKGIELLPQPLPSPLNQWITSVVEDKPATEFGVDEAVQLTMLMEAAYQADKEKCSISVK